MYLLPFFLPLVCCSLEQDIQPYPHILLFPRLSTKSIPIFKLNNRSKHSLTSFVSCMILILHYIRPHLLVYCFLSTMMSGSCFIVSCLPYGSLQSYIKKPKWIVQTHVFALILQFVTCHIPAITQCNVGERTRKFV